VAKFFSRIFFRNAINNGLPVIELREGIDTMKKGDTVAIDFENGAVTYEGNRCHFPALPKEVLAILQDGGLVPHVRKELGKG
jgi:3-isopropylmalate/(R)-2-methylmalate dehydratase small subunit